MRAYVDVGIVESFHTSSEWAPVIVKWVLGPIVHCEAAMGG